MSRPLRWIALALALMSASRASAQDTRAVEGAAGYSFMHDYAGNVTFSRGWFGTAGFDIAGPVRVVGDASGSYKSARGPDVRMSVHTLTFMAGPKVAWSQKRLVPYAQMLFGVARTATAYDLPNAHLSAAQNYFAMAPGGGVDLPFSGRVAIRVGANLRLIRGERFTSTGSRPSTFREFQFITGIALR